MLIRTGLGFDARARLRHTLMKMAGKVDVALLCVGTKKRHVSSRIITPIRVSKSLLCVRSRNIKKENVIECSG